MYTTDLSVQQRFLLALSVFKYKRAEIFPVTKETYKLDTQNVISNMNILCYIFTYWSSLICLYEVKKFACLILHIDA